MFLFYRLLLAHFITDFPFQTKEVFYLKGKNIWGGILHALIFLFVACLFSIPYLDKPLIWIFILALSLSHFIIDGLKLRVGGNNLLGFILDQTIHILFISGILLFKEASIPRYLSGNFISSFYNNNSLIIYLIGLIIATYGGSFLIYYIKKDFVDDKILYRRDYDGMIERMVITLLFIWGGNIILLLPVVVAIRALFYLSLFGYLKASPDIITRGEPSIAYQKVKLKSNLGIDLLASPIFAILTSVIIKGL